MSILDKLAEEYNEPEEYEAQEWKPDLSSDIDYMIPFPGVAQDIQQWILKNSIYPQPAIAYAATMSILSTAYGRYLRYGNIKGNLMFIAMAESGEGKDWPFKACELILRAINLDHCISGQMASGSAMMEALQETPSMLFHIDEFGNYLNSINNKNANVYSREIVDIMTKAYTDAHLTLTGKRCKGSEAIKIKEPNLCVLGLSTERQIFDGLRTSDLANGSLARYSVLFGLRGLMPKRIRPNYEVPDNIKSGLMDLINSFNNQLFIVSKNLEVSEEYDDLRFQYMCEVKEKSNSLLEKNDGKEAFIPIYNRIVYRAVQSAMLIDQCKSADVLTWFFELEKKSCDIFVKKFMHLGADNEDESMFKWLQSKIIESGKKGIKAADLTRKTQKIKTRARNEMINELLNCDLIFKREIKTGKQRPTTFYYWKK